MFRLCLSSFNLLYLFSVWYTLSLWITPSHFSLCGHKHRFPSFRKYWMLAVHIHVLLWELPESSCLKFCTLTPNSLLPSEKKCCVFSGNNSEEVIPVAGLPLVQPRCMLCAVDQLLILPNSVTVLQVFLGAFPNKLPAYTFPSCDYI